MKSLKRNKILGLIVFITLLINCGGKDDSVSIPPSIEELSLSYIRLDDQSLFNNPTIKLGTQIFIGFNKAVNPTSTAFLFTQGSINAPFVIKQGESNTELILTPNNALEEGVSYTLTITNSFIANDGSTYNGSSFPFKIESIPLTIENATVDGANLELSTPNQDIALLPKFKFTFSHPVTETELQSNLQFSPSTNFTISQIDANTIEVIPSTALTYWKNYQLKINSSLGATVGRDFNTSTYDLFTIHDLIDKFPIISDEELLTKIQKETFKYFWELGHPISGMALERNTSSNVVTTGGTGFGLMAMIVAAERGFITRAEAINRWQTIVGFLETADRFHGVWPHWLNGNTGVVQPFSAQDDGADLVETAFLIQGLLAVREYLNDNDVQEAAIIDKITQLWEEVEWTWFTKGDEDVLYWHWSPNHGWDINLKIQGHNETQIIYVLAAASPTYPIDADVYTNGYTSNGSFKNGNSYYNYNLPVGPNKGGPLFFSHYSYLALDPRNLQDAYVNYWTQNVNHSKINYSYCVDNPENYIGYSAQCWGLTASDNHEGYSAHSPTNDKGVITPTAAISALPYAPDESMEAIKYFYYKIGDRILGDYGFIDAFNPTEEWYATSYLAIDQGPQIVMIENYRTQLLWNLFMQIDEVQNGLDNLGFTY
ncbi:glucoamylase family protein [Flavivirga aquimarina]|uniref:Glucoamylase family protein n=1 Tax=Flavivirga aquimarina TaxID=2027862 RepID=A0ABT8W8H4_9FLAO|nr:glucoamylase family protein [Flavivirga aquimarina]MDO5969433.1 glucoamylase family protein [Flavivirga aquimarina]